MSVYAIARAFNFSQSKGSQLLTLLAIADSCNDLENWGFCWVGFDYLGNKARISSRLAKLYVHNLISLKELICFDANGVLKPLEQQPPRVIEEGDTVKTIYEHAKGGTGKSNFYFVSCGLDYEITVKQASQYIEDVITKRYKKSSNCEAYCKRTVKQASQETVLNSLKEKEKEIQENQKIEEEIFDKILGEEDLANPGDVQQLTSLINKFEVTEEDLLDIYGANGLWYKALGGLRGVKPRIGDIVTSVTDLKTLTNLRKGLYRYGIRQP